jgi:hypothetical protein
MTKIDSIAASRTLDLTNQGALSCGITCNLAIELPNCIISIKAESSCYVLNVLNDWNYLNLPQEGLFHLPDETKTDGGAFVGRVAPAPER